MTSIPQLNAARVVLANAMAFLFALAAASGPAQARYSVYYYQDGRTLQNLSDADALIASTAPVATQTLDVLDISDFSSARSQGRFGGAASTPVPLANRDNFAIYAVTGFDVAIGGDYTFLLHSDDGARIVVDGVTIVEFANPRPPRDSFSTLVNLTPGRHLIEVTYFERRGEAALEVGVAPGLATAFSPSAFSLVASAPEPNAWAFMMLGFGLIANRMKRIRANRPARCSFGSIDRQFAR